MPEKKKNKMTMIIIGVIILVVLCSSSIAAYMFMNKKTTSVVDASSTDVSGSNSPTSTSNTSNTSNTPNTSKSPTPSSSTTTTPPTTTTTPSLPPPPPPPPPVITATKTTANGAIFQQISNERCSTTTGAPGGLSIDEVLNKCAVENNLGGSGRPCIGIMTDPNNSNRFYGCLDVNVTPDTGSLPNTSWIKKGNATSTATTPTTFTMPEGSISTDNKVTTNGAKFEQISNIRCYSVTGAPNGSTLDEVLNNCAKTTNLGGSRRPCVGITVDPNDPTSFGGCLETWFNESSPNTSWIKTRDANPS